MIKFLWYKVCITTIFFLQAVYSLYEGTREILETSTSSTADTSDSSTEASTSTTTTTSDASKDTDTL